MHMGKPCQGIALNVEPMRQTDIGQPSILTTQSQTLSNWTGCYNREIFAHSVRSGLALIYHIEIQSPAFEATVRLFAPYFVM